MEWGEGKMYANT